MKKPPPTTTPTPQDLKALRKWIHSKRNAHILNLIERTDARETYEEADWVKHLHHYLDAADNVIVAYIVNLAGQYDPSSGIVSVLRELAAKIREGDHRTASEHGELDDLL